jgi:hypothetical protein
LQSAFNEIKIVVKVREAMTQQEMKDWIDSASYEQLLRKWRFAPAGDPFFCGEIGGYYTEKLHDKKQEVGQSEHVAASKSIGW